MTINVTSHGNAGANASSANLTIGPFTPAAGALLMVAVQADTAGSISISGHGTWTEVIAAQWSSSATRYTRIFACIVGGSPSSASVTISTGYAWRKEADVFELTGDVDTSGTVADAFGAWDLTDGYDLSPTVATPGAFDSATNTTFAVSGGYNSNNARTFEGGYSTSTRHANSNFSMQCGWIGAEDNSVSVDSGRYATTGLLAFEIKEAAGGGDVELVVADCTHAHGVDAPALTQANTLSVADTVHAHGVDAPALTQAHILAVADALHTHAAEAVALGQANTLAVADAAHGHTVDGLTLTVGHVLAVADAAHAHTADSVALVQSHILAVADALHGHAAESPAPSVAGTLSVADASHAHAVDAVSLTQAHVLVVNDAAHGHAVEAVTLSQGVLLAVADALHAHGVDAVELTQAHVLAVQDASHAHAADAVALSQASVLVVSDTLHAHLAEALALRMPGAIGAATLFVVAAEARIIVVAPSQRYFTVH